MLSNDDDGLSKVVDDRILFGMEKLVNKMKTKNNTIDDLLSNKTDKNSISSQQKKEHVPTASPMVSVKGSTWDAPKLDLDLLSQKSTNNKMSFFDMMTDDDPILHKTQTPSIKTEKDDLDMLNPLIRDDNNKSEERRRHYDKSEGRRRRDDYDDESRHGESKPRNIEDIAQLLGEWEDLARKHSDRDLKKFNNYSSPDDIKLEIKKLRARKSRESASKYMSLGIIICAKILEAMSRTVKIVDVDLTGWSASLKHNMSDFDDVFADIYDVHVSKINVKSPFSKLAIAFSLNMVNFYMMNKGANMVANFLNKNKNKNNSKATTKATFREMTPPNLEDDPELEELLIDLEKRKKGKLS